MQWIHTSLGRKWLSYGKVSLLAKTVLCWEKHVQRFCALTSMYCYVTRVVKVYNWGFQLQYHKLRYSSHYFSFSGSNFTGKMCPLRVLYTLSKEYTYTQNGSVPIKPYSIFACLKGTIQSPSHYDINSCCIQKFQPPWHEVISRMPMNFSLV